MTLVQPRRILAALALGVVATGAVVAQQGGVAPVDGSGSFEVNGVRVDVAGRTAEAARTTGWRLAQRKGWQMLSQRLTGQARSLPDGTLDSLVTSIVVESEQIAPNRYIARLGVLFNRSRAASILGIAGVSERSPAMLVVPLIWDGGTGTVFERATPWQAAWARFRTGGSVMDYVRPSGTGADGLLLNAGQVTRRGRGWWRTVLNQYGASDVLIPQVRLYRQWPGGPVIGTFTAGYGPDNRLLGSFSLRVNQGDAVPALLDEGVRRLDALYQQGLRSGALRPDLVLAAPPPGSVILPDEEEIVDPTSIDAGATPTPVPTGDSVTLSIQADTPTVAAVESTEAALRSVPGVRSAATSSLALGGVSVLRVTFDGDIAILSAALESRGWQVQQGDGALRIRRRAASTPTAPPSAPQE
ncbi:heavy-metal-associated domain-containing protein [Sphingomonas lacusdianchii]|uniref:heavy-metal-associated domain-containing protein n=1 Tax=Sphingomonas lacusdianchii TaxID=2917992 RepID=UPI001F55DA42|nr:heavy-metal-associated domain-containing protein [Sphingomonas sp. JXJ CY 53]